MTATPVARLLWGVSAGLTLLALALILPDLFNERGKLVPRDFLALWSAGLRVWDEAPLAAYDWSAHKEFQRHLLGIAEELRLGFFYPPHFLFFLAPFALLSYPAATYSFLLLTLGLYVLALKLVVRDWASAVLLALAFGGAFACFWWAQIGFLVAALLVGGLALLPRGPALAGILFGILTIKPHFGVVLALALLIRGEWKAICWAVTTAAALGIAAELAFGPGAWEAFFQSADYSTRLLREGLVKTQSVFNLLLPYTSEGIAALVHGLVATGAVGVFVWSERSGAPYGLKAAVLISATLLVTPYLYSYDAVMLTGAAAFLLRDAPPMEERDQFLIVLICMLPAAYAIVSYAAVPLSAGLMLAMSVYQILRSRGGTIPTAAFMVGNADVPDRHK